MDIDLEKFFDKVNHDVLMGRVAKRISDKRVLKLIRSFLNAGMMENGLAKPTEAGVPQGGPLTLVTMLQTLAPNRGQFKRECTNPERHVHLFLIDFDAFDERSDNLPFCFPIQVCRFCLSV